MENPIKMDDLGVPLFLETPICYSCIHFNTKFETNGARLASAILSPSSSFRMRVMKLHTVEFGGYLGIPGQNVSSIIKDLCKPKPNISLQKTPLSAKPGVVHIYFKCIIIS